MIGQEIFFFITYVSLGMMSETLINTVSQERVLFPSCLSYRDVTDAFLFRNLWDSRIFAVDPSVVTCYATLNVGFE